LSDSKSDVIFGEKLLAMKTVVLFLCILSVLFYVTMKVLSQKGRSNVPSSLFWIVPAIVAIPFMFLMVVPAQECAVVVTPGGVKQNTLYTGWHLVLPWYSMERMDKTSQVYTCADQTSYSNQVQSGTIWTPTVDGIKMGFDISASWRIDPEYAWWIYDNVSENDDIASGRYYWLEENVIKPKLKSALALTTSKYTPIEVYSNRREEIQQEVIEKMRTGIEAYHLILDQVDIREVYYNKDYETAINQKKLEEQKALTLIEVTKQKKELQAQAVIDKEIEITKAQAEAEALKIKGQSVASNPKIVELEWINKWDGKLPEYMLGSGQGVMLNLKN